MPSWIRVITKIQIPTNKRNMFRHIYSGFAEARGGKKGSARKRAQPVHQNKKSLLQSIWAEKSSRDKPRKGSHFEGM
jgi:hypothetical protein